MRRAEQFGFANYSFLCPIPAIAQLVEHLTVDHCSNQMVPGSIPGGRTFVEAVIDAVYAEF